MQVVVSLRATADVVKPANVALMAVVDKSGSMQVRPMTTNISALQKTDTCCTSGRNLRSQAGLGTCNTKGSEPLLHPADVSAAVNGQLGTCSTLHQVHSNCLHATGAES